MDKSGVTEEVSPKSNYALISNKIFFASCIFIILIIFVIIVYFLIFSYFRIFEKITFDENIKGVRLNNEKNSVYIKLADDIPNNISKIKFNFFVEDKIFVYDLVMNGVEIPYKSEYEINSKDVGLDNFNNLNKISLSFEYLINKTNNKTIIPILTNKTNPVAHLPSSSGGGGRGRGGGGNSNPSCSNDLGCSSAGFFCDGNQSFNCSLGSDGCYNRVNMTVCNSSQICFQGTCQIFQGCNSNANCSFLNKECSNWICNSSMNICQVVYNSSINICRNSSNTCEIPQYCTESSEFCPPTIFKINGTLCNDYNPKTQNDSCVNGVCIGICVVNLTNTTWSNWINISLCKPDNTINQSRNKTQYDSNNCRTFNNATIFENRTVSCIYKSLSISISIATLNDSYISGSQIYLTDPPDNKINNFYSNFNSNENINTNDVGVGYSLAENQINELASLYSEKLNQKANIEKNYGNLQIQASLENNLNNIETNLHSKMEDYGIPFDIEEQLDEINSKNPGWTSNFNPIFLKSDEYKKKISSGILLDDSEINKLNSESLTFSTSSLSSSGFSDFFDWRNVSGKNYISPIKDQGGCGSCWAFASTAVLEGVANAYYNQIINPDLSEQDLVSCFIGDGCNGASSGEIENIFNFYWIYRGQANESCFPYTASNGNCSNKCFNWQAGAWKTTGYVNVDVTNNAIENIKNVLINYGPVEVGMEVYNDFFSYSGGIYSHVSGGLAGYHAVTIVGYGSYDGQTYWIVKNSWGTSWGEKGYFKILSGDSMIDSWFAYTTRNPVSPNVLTKICEDQDDDGYCNWGLGTKPSSGCPASCSSSSIEDCDDLNISIYQGCGVSNEITGTLNITSVPDTASVYVQDLSSGQWVYRGQTPLQINLDVGNRVVKMSKEDFVDYLITVSINQNQITQIQVVMDTAPKIYNIFNNDILRAGDIIQINGTISNNNLSNYKIEYARSLGLNKNWISDGINLANGGTKSVVNGILATWDTGSMNSDYYDIKITMNLNDGNNFIIYINQTYFDRTLKKGWPQHIDYFHDFSSLSNPILTSGKFYSVTPLSGYGEKETGSMVVLTKDKLSDYLKSIQDNLGGNYWPGYIQPVVADLDNNGKKEIIVYFGGDPPEVMVYDTEGNLLWKKGIGSGGIAGGNLDIPHIADINDDGYNEIVVFNPNIGSSKKNSYVYALKYDSSILWNVSVPLDYHATMLIADLNRDGKKEVVVQGNSAGNRTMTVLSNNGEIISKWGLNKNSWFSTLEPSPAVGDFNCDGNLEIVSTAPSEKAGYNYTTEEWINEQIVEVYYMNGSLMKGWPIYLNGSISSSPVVGDINKDGYPEIVLGLIYASNTFPDTRYGGLYVLNRNGSISPGWPFKIGYNFWSTPSLGDIDNDGYLEIAASRLGFVTYLIKYNGTILNGWPTYTSWNDYYGSIMVDVNNDNKLDILTSAGNGFSSFYNGGIYGWNNNGSVIPGFPKITEVDAQASPVILDIDNNGKNDLIASSDWDYDFIIKEHKIRGSIYIWDLNSTYNSSLSPWPMFQHDTQHTGCYDCKESKPQSKILNNEAFDLTGILIMVLQRNVSSNWINESIVVNKIVNVPANGLLKLDSEWNPNNVIAQNIGKYRVYASFETNGQAISNSWEFDSVSGGLPSLSIIGKIIEFIKSILDKIIYIIVAVIFIFLIIILNKIIKFKSKKSRKGKK